MLQVELRLNGQLIEYVDVINQGLTLDGTHGKYTKYHVSQGRNQRTVYHNQEHGAMVLARLALESLTTRRHLKPKALPRAFEEIKHGTH